MNTHIGDVRTALGLIAIGLAACSGSPGDRPCSITTGAGCVAPEVCESVAANPGGATACYAPLLVEGTLADSTLPRGVPFGRIVLVDENGAALAPAGGSDNVGHFAVRLPSPRDALGLPTAQRIALHAEARGYEQFPAPFRPAALIDAGSAVTRADGLVIDVGSVDLIPTSAAGVGVISGHIDLPATTSATRGPVVVVADELPADGSAGATSLVDSAGAYTLFDLPPGHYQISALSPAATYPPVPFALNAGEEAVFDFRSFAAPRVSVTSSLRIINAVGPTTIKLAIAATWDPLFPRGTLAPGLEATALGTGTFVIDGVPPGRYVVLTAFGDDNLTRDPSTPAPVITVSSDVTLNDTQLVVPRLAIVSPGANGIETVTAPPTLSWQAIGGAESYHVSVVNADGLSVFSGDVAGATTQLDYSGPFTAGMYYQLRVIARDHDGATIAATGDLVGVFVASPS